MAIRFAQISDIHCFRVTLNPAQFFSKRWLGNVNVMANRRLKFCKDPDLSLLDLFRNWQAEHVLICGDLTTTALSAEFEVALRFVEQMEKEGMSAHVVPGNHDIYTRHAERDQTFYQFFDAYSRGDGWSLRHHQVAPRPLGPGWWWVGIDAAIATPIFSSVGYFSEETEKNLDKLLSEIPEGDRVVLVNHFPMFSTIHPSHDLKRGEALRALLSRHPQVKLYLHGHVHRQSITDPRNQNLPIILNSGCCGLRRRATCHLVEIHDTGCLIQVYGCEQRFGQVKDWTLQEEVSFSW